MLWFVVLSVYYVEVDSGVESVQLPCKTTVYLPGDARVEWQNNDNDKVLVYQNNSDQPEEQNWFYKGRTEMKRTLLKTGDLSLTLKYPTVRDKGAFTCTVYNREGNILMKKQVEFRVKVPQVVEVDSGVESVQLPCKTTVHLPEDVKVEWRNSYNWMIHVCQNGFDKPEEQDEEYISRTEVKKNLLKTGDLSLTLKYPTVRDRNTYTCIIYSSEGHILMKEDVQLLVKDCQVEVEEGVESVQLPFRTTANLPGDAKVDWKREEPEPKMTVHLYQKGFDQAEEQNQFYKGRTELNKDHQKTGDFSLTLKYPTVRDNGTYVCYFRSLNIWRENTVLLKVKSQLSIYLKVCL
ncbi:butyrophilin-like protein 2 [Channa argus]|uniref:butyrophilin-like protein 2 n=1 Tax=Channa argus TaxID=215402 RepID=UPI003521F873